MYKINIYMTGLSESHLVILKLNGLVQFSRSFYQVTRHSLNKSPLHQESGYLLSTSYLEQVSKYKHTI